MDKELVIATYKEFKNVRATSKELKISEQKVRKILIDARIYTPPLAIKIRKLLEEEKTIEEIAYILKISTKTVNANMPYARKPYNMSDLSDNALKLKAWRQNKKTSTD